MSDGLRDWLRTLEPADREEEPIGVFDELDELRQQRVERADPRWFPSDGNLVRLVEERRAGSRAPTRDR